MEVVPVNGPVVCPSRIMEVPYQTVVIPAPIPGEQVRVHMEAGTVSPVPTPGVQVRVHMEVDTVNPVPIPGEQVRVVKFV